MQIKINPATFFVFDLDDTLYREIDFLKSAYRHIAMKLQPLININLYEQMFAKYEKQENVFQWIVDSYGKNIPSIDLTWLLNEYRLHQPQIRMSHDTADFLRKAAAYGVPAGLITDGRSLTQRNKLRALGIETFFQDIIISEEFGSEKPDERNYLYFKEKYPGKEFYFFGDNLSKDFLIPCKLGWQTICMLDNGNNIHKQIFTPECRVGYKISTFQDVVLVKSTIEAPYNEAIHIKKHKQNALKKLISLSRKLGIHKSAKRFVRYLPLKFRARLKLQAGQDVISVDQIQPQFEKACRHLIKTIGMDSVGDYLEFGVFRGTSINCMYQVLTESGLNHVRLFGFDSFEGMPEVTKMDDQGVWHPGQFRSELEETKYFLTKKGIDWKKTFLIKGWFSDTLTEKLKSEHNIQKASIIMIDCDIYTSTKEALNFCKSLILDTSILVFDDWNSGNLADQNLGEKKAFDEFLQANPNFIAEEFGGYSYKGKPNGKLFLVTNTKTSSYIN